MEKNNYKDQIEPFLDKTLSQEETLRFTEALKKDALLEQIVKEEILFRQAVTASQEEMMKADIKKWRSEKREATPAATVRPMLYKMAAAASVALLLGFFTFSILRKQYSNEAILANHYTEDTELLSGLKGDSGADVLAAGLADFEAGKYPQAMEQLQQFPGNDKAIYTLAHSFYLTQQYPKAITSFQKTIIRQNPQYVQKAEWYLLLSYIGNNQLDTSFNQLLEKVISEKGAFSSEAQDIKEKLNSFWRR